MYNTFNTSDPVTYKDLFKVMEAFPERLLDHISIKIGDEFYEIQSINIASNDSNDILDDGHIYLAVKDN